MATMFPEFLGKKKREAVRESREGDAFDLLKLNLPDNYICIYEPRIPTPSKKGLIYHPDFVIFGENVGCMVCEVKNWNWGRIIKNKEKRDPYKQVRQHCFALEDFLRKNKDASYIVKHGIHKGKLNFHAVPTMIMLGASIEQKQSIAEHLNLDQRWFLTEEELKDKTKLVEFFKSTPRYFRENLTFETLMEAAKTLVNKTTNMTLKDDDMENVKDKTQIDRYNEFKDELLKITQKLIADDIVQPGTSSSRALQELIKKLEADEFLVGIFGIIATGKSTLLNALMGDNYLKQGTGETSKVLTYIRKPEDKNPEGSTKIEYKSTEELSEEIFHILYDTGYLTDYNLDDLDISKIWNIKDPETRKKLANVIEGSSTDSDEPIKEAVKFIKGLLSGWSECSKYIYSDSELKKDNSLNIEKSSIEELKKKIDEAIDVSDPITEKERTEAVSTYIKSVTIYNTNKLTEKNVTMVDSPGLGSNFIRHTKLAQNVLMKSDMVLLITKPEHKFGPPDKAFLENHITMVNRKQKDNNIIFVLNKIGLIPENTSSPAREEDMLRQEISSTGLENVRIYQTDAERAMWARKKIRGDELSIKDQKEFYKAMLTDEVGRHIENPEKNLISSKVPEFEESFANNLFDLKLNKSLRHKLNRMEEIVKEFEKIKEDELKALESDKKSLEKEKKQHDENKKHVLNILRGYLGKEGEFENQLSEQVYYDEYDTIKECTNTIAEIIADEYSKHYLSKGKKNSREYMAWILHKSESRLKATINGRRKKFEDRYIPLRESALQDQIPHFLKHYKEYEKEIRHKKIETVDVVEKISGLLSLKLSLFQKFMNLFRFKETKKQSIKKYILQNFREDFELYVRTNLQKWINDDKKYFKGQIHKKVERIYSENMEGLKRKEDNLKLNAKERKAKKDEINTYIMKTRSLLGSPSLRELRNNINNLENIQSNPI